MKIQGMRKLFLPMLLLGLVACSTSKKAIEESAFVPKFPNYTLADYQQGKSLYENNCGTCHDLKKPSSLDKVSWVKIVPPMVKKVNQEAGKQILSSADEDKILKFVLSSI